MFKGNPKFFFGIMSDETRFQIAQMVSADKKTSDVWPMFREAEAKAGRWPQCFSWA